MFVTCVFVRGINQDFGGSPVQTLTRKDYTKCQDHIPPFPEKFSIP